MHHKVAFAGASVNTTLLMPLTLNLFREASNDVVQRHDDQEDRGLDQAGFEKGADLHRTRGSTQRRSRNCFRIGTSQTSVNFTYAGLVLPSSVVHW